LGIVVAATKILVFQSLFILPKTKVFGWAENVKRFLKSCNVTDNAIFIICQTFKRGRYISNNKEAKNEKK